MRELRSWFATVDGNLGLTTAVAGINTDGLINGLSTDVPGV